MSDNSFDAAQKALRNRAVVDLEEPLPDEQPARWWLRIVVVLVFFMFGAIVWLSWRDNAGDGTPLIVEAPPGEIKERPQDGGGLKPTNSGTVISDSIGDNPGTVPEPVPDIGPIAKSVPPVRPGEEEIPPVDEPTIAAVPPVGDTVPLSGITPSNGSVDAPVNLPNTQPVVPDVPAPTVTAQDSGPSDPSGLTVQTLPPVEGVPIAPPTPPATPAPVLPVAPSEPGAGSGPTAIVPPLTTSEPDVAAVPTPVEPDEAELVDEPNNIEETEEAALVPPPPPPQRTTSSVRIQVGSLRSEAAANTAWNRVRQRNEDVLDGVRLVVVRAEVKGSTYFRAQAEGFQSRAAAQEACATIKRRGTDCLVVGR